MSEPTTKVVEPRGWHDANPFTVETSLFRCFLEGYCSLQKYAEGIDNVCGQICTFLTEFNVAVSNIDLCVLSTGCFAFVEYHRQSQQTSKPKNTGSKTKQISVSEGEVDDSNADGDWKQSITDRFGPWRFTHVFQKRVASSNVRELITSTIRKARDESARQVVTFCSTIISEVGCHVILWHNGPKISVPPPFEFAFEIFFDETTSDCAAAEPLPAGSSPGSQKSNVLGDIDTDDSKPADESSLGKSGAVEGLDPNEPDPDVVTNKGEDPETGKQEKTEQEKENSEGQSFSGNSARPQEKLDRVEVTEFLQWCQTKEGDIGTPKRDRENKSARVRIISISVARVDFKRYLVASFYRKAAKPEATSPPPVLPIPVFKTLFPRVHRTIAPQQSALLTLAADANSLDQTWTAFGKAVKSVVRCVNASPESLRATTNFYITVGPADAGVEVLVLHNCTAITDGKNDFLPATLPKTLPSSTCVVL